MPGYTLRLWLLIAVQVLAVVAKRTCTSTSTVYTTERGFFRTKRSTEPIVTYYSYSTTKFILTAYHPGKAVTTASGGTNCNLYTGTDIPPAPTSSNFISIIPKSSSVAARDLDELEARNPAKCTTTVVTTTTVTVKKICTTTQIGEPPATIIPRSGTLTTKIPSFCANPPGINTETGTPDGLGVYEASGYPFFPQNAVECCVACSRFYVANLVASGFIASAKDCMCLIDTGNSNPGKSNICPNGIQVFKPKPKKKGNVILGPCGTPS